MLSRGMKLSREILKFYKLAIKITFEGGFAVDADFGDAFSGSIEGPKNHKKPKKSINFIIFPGGGPGPSTVLFVGPVFR
jgi:hypothetical protein